MTPIIIAATWQHRPRDSTDHVAPAPEAFTYTVIRPKHTVATHMFDFLAQFLVLCTAIAYSLSVLLSILGESTTGTRGSAAELAGQRDACAVAELEHMCRASECGMTQQDLVDLVTAGPTTGTRVERWALTDAPPERKQPRLHALTEAIERYVPTPRVLTFARKRREGRQDTPGRRRSVMTDGYLNNVNVCDAVTSRVLVPNIRHDKAGHVRFTDGLSPLSSTRTRLETASHTFTKVRRLQSTTYRPSWPRMSLSL